MSCLHPRRGPRLGPREARRRGQLHHPLVHRRPAGHQRAEPSATTSASPRSTASSAPSVSREVSITLDEYLEFLRISKDEAGDDFYVVHHASWNDLEQNLEAVRGAEEAGADLVLLAYPPNFYPESEQEIYDYTKAVCDATNLGIILFPMTIWNFGARIHPSDLPTRLIRRLIDDIPNIAVIKAEGGYPNIQSAVECNRLFGDEVVISVPIEGDLIPLSQVMPIQLSATSDHEYYGPMIPRVMQLLRDGKHDDATAIYWQLHPARKAKAALFADPARWVGPQPPGLEVPGLAAGLQRRTAPPADDAPPGQPDGRPAQGTRRRRPRAEHGSHSVSSSSGATRPDRGPDTKGPPARPSSGRPLACGIRPAARRTGPCRGR